MDHYGFGTGDEMRSQDESRTQGGKEKKQGTKLVFFLPKLLLRVVSPPVLDLHYLYLYCCSFSSWKSRHCQNKILQIF
jgi:hypothetical protein